MTQLVVAFVNFGCNYTIVYFRHIVRPTYDKITYANRYRKKTYSVLELAFKNEGQIHGSEGTVAR